MVAYVETPLGIIELKENGQAVTNLSFCHDGKKTDDCIEPSSALLKETIHQLKEYFNGSLRKFTLPLYLEGTDFQRRVWNALLDIPYGETRSYKQIAEAAGNIKACRAVGMANHTNPIAIIVPCHRVIGANGTMVGYGGGLDIKESLLQLEGILPASSPQWLCFTN